MNIWVRVVDGIVTEIAESRGAGDGWEQTSQWDVRRGWAKNADGTFTPVAKADTNLKRLIIARDTFHSTVHGLAVVLAEVQEFYEPDDVRKGWHILNSLHRGQYLWARNEIRGLGQLTVARRIQGIQAAAAGFTDLSGDLRANPDLFFNIASGLPEVTGPILIPNPSTLAQRSISDAISNPLRPRMALPAGTPTPAQLMRGKFPIES